MLDLRPKTKDFLTVLYRSDSLQRSETSLAKAVRNYLIREAGDADCNLMSFPLEMNHKH
jgi:hypothetical protein